jgi:hypothetical protein
VTSGPPTREDSNAANSRDGVVDGQAKIGTRITCGSVLGVVTRFGTALATAAGVRARFASR